MGSAADAELAPLDELIPLDEPSQSEMTLADISDNDDDASDEYGLAPAPLPPARPQTPPLPSRAGTNSVTDDAMDFLDQMVPLPGDDQPSSAGDFLSATAGEPLAAAAGKKDFFGRGRRVRGKGNVWDSPLLLIGGGVLLLLLILGGVLLWAISRESAEEMLRIVPQDLREASYALGVPKWKTIVRIVLPTSLAGIITGIMLALARVMGETAPLLILVGYAPFINFNLFGGEMGSLPGLMVAEMNNPTEAGSMRIWGAALTLILIIAILNIAAKLIGRFSQVK